MAIYQINANGTTYSGSTNFFGANPTFNPVANFSLPGALAVSSPLDPNPATARNGVNVFDIGLLLGTPFDGDVRAGEMIWASNNALHDGFARTRTGKASIDEVTQYFDPVNNILTSVIDTNVAPTTNLDFFVQSGGLFGAPRQIVAGQVVLDFSPDMRSVTGTATFFGGGYIEPGTFAEVVSFSGVFVG